MYRMYQKCTSCSFPIELLYVYHYITMQSAAYGWITYNRRLYAYFRKCLKYEFSDIILKMLQVQKESSCMQKSQKVYEIEDHKSQREDPLYIHLLFTSINDNDVKYLWRL